MTTPDTPLGRVQRYLRKRSTTRLPDEINGVFGSGPDEERAELNTSDLQFMADSLDRIRNLAYRASGGGGDRDLMATIFHIAAGVARGLPAPAAGRPLPLTVKPDGGGVYTSRDDFDPYAAGGGGHRTRTCVHCQRRCGDVPGGSGVINAVPVCYPTESGRPNCYRNISVEGHTLHSCTACDVYNLPFDQMVGLPHTAATGSRTDPPPMPALEPLQKQMNTIDMPNAGQIRMGRVPLRQPEKLTGPFGPVTDPLPTGRIELDLHIKQIGSRLNLCQAQGGEGASSPNAATCADCRRIYAASGDSEIFVA